MTCKKCRCSNQHRTYLEFAECVWQEAECWGSGKFALLSTCRGHQTVSLHRTLGEALEVRRKLKDVGCGGQCNPLGHHVIYLHKTKSPVPVNIRKEPRHDQLFL